MFDHVVSNLATRFANNFFTNAFAVRHGADSTTDATMMRDA